jgi:glutathione S-transferase
VKIAESLVLIEFVNDLAPEKGLLPTDPVKRAKARFFIEAFSSKFGAPWFAAISKGEDPSAILPALDTLIELLPKDPNAYAVGEFSLADAAVIPFLARAFAALKNDVGSYDEGKRKALYDIIQGEVKYERLRQYYALVSSRDSFQSTFFEVCLPFLMRSSQ